MPLTERKRSFSGPSDACEKLNDTLAYLGADDELCNELREFAKVCAIQALTTPDGLDGARTSLAAACSICGMLREAWDMGYEIALVARKEQA